MKTSTMLWIGAAAVAGYYLAKRAQSGVASAAQAVSAPPTAAAVPQTVVVVQPDDYGDGGWVWGPSWGSFGGSRGGGGHHHGGGGHHGGHH